jgi:hypothetical protein
MFLSMDLITTYRFLSPPGGWNSPYIFKDVSSCLFAKIRIAWVPLSVSVG